MPNAAVHGQDARDASDESHPTARRKARPGVLSLTLRKSRSEADGTPHDCTPTRSGSPDRVMRNTDATAQIRAGVAGGHRVQGRAFRRRRGGEESRGRGAVATGDASWRPIRERFPFYCMAAGPLFRGRRFHPIGLVGRSPLLHPCAVVNIVYNGNTFHCISFTGSDALKEARLPPVPTPSHRPACRRRSPKSGGTSRWSEKFFLATTQRPSAPDDDRTRLWAESLPVYCDVRATCYPVMSGG